MFPKFPLLLFLALFLFTGGRATCEEAAFQTLFADKLSETEGIAACPDGSLFVAENRKGIVYRIVSDTELEVYKDGFKFPAGMACGPDNTLYLLEYGRGDVIALKKGGEAVRAEIVIEGLTTPNAMVVRADGTLLVSETDPGRVTAIGKDGKTETVVDGIQYANGLALNEDESLLYVNSTTGNKIYVVAMSGENKGKKKIFLKAAPMIDGLVRAADGSLYACLFMKGDVIRITPDGKTSVVAKKLEAPASPAIGNGALYVTNLRGKGIGKIPLPKE